MSDEKKQPKIPVTVEELRRAFGEYLCEVRIQMSLTQATMAEICGLSLPQYQRLEKGGILAPNKPGFLDFLFSGLFEEKTPENRKTRRMLAVAYDASLMALGQISADIPGDIDRIMPVAGFIGDLRLAGEMVAEIEKMKTEKPKIITPNKKIITPGQA